MRDIIGLVPYGFDTITDEKGNRIHRDGRPCNWHFILFDKWFDTGLRLPEKCQFYLSKCDGIGSELYFKRCFGSNFNNTLGEPYYHYNFIKLPWHLECFAHSFLINDEWIEAPTPRLGSEDEKIYNSLKENADKKVFVFSKPSGILDGKILMKPVIAEVYAECYHDSIYWFPNWLKRLINRKRKRIQIEFSSEIGPGSGSWKGGILGLTADFEKDIETSWEKFRNTELQKLLGRK